MIHWRKLFWRLCTIGWPPDTCTQDITVDEVVDGNAWQKDLQTSSRELAGDVLQDPLRPCSFVFMTSGGIPSTELVD